MAARPDGLKARRDELGFSQEGAAEALAVSVSTYQCWEQGLRTPRGASRQDIARVFGVPIVEVARWFDRRSEVPDRLTVPPWLGTFASFEQGASEVWTYQCVSIPGLLQTRAYAEAVQREDIVPPTDEEVERWVRHRLTRQAVLDREPEPLRLEAVIDESVLWRVAGDRTVMSAQLAHLAEMAKRSNIDVRVLPLDRGTHLAAFGAFTVITSEGAFEPFMTIVLDRCMAHYTELPNVVEAHSELFRHLQRVALSPADSIALIRTTAKERYHR